MKGTRSKVVVGSIVGAAAIHMVMLACSGGGNTPPRSDSGSMDVAAFDASDRGNDVTSDRGNDVAKNGESGVFDVVMDVVRDVMGELVDAEVHDAEAGGDGGVVTRTCDCLPPAPTHTVSFTLMSPTGAVTPVPGLSTAVTTVTRQPATMDVPMGIAKVESTATFWTGPGRRYSDLMTLNCVTYVRLPALTLTPGDLPRCSLLGTIANGAADARFDSFSTGPATDVEVTVLTETQITYRIPRFAIQSRDMGEPVYTFTGLTFSATIPGGHLLTPVDAFRAP